VKTKTQSTRTFGIYLRRKFIAMSAYLRTIGEIHINNLIMHLGVLETKDKLTSKPTEEKK
jgi:hypothetical protein